MTEAGEGGLAERIHALPVRLVLAITGGGVQAASKLLTVPGGSQTVLDVQVPYSRTALVEFLGRAPDRFCAEETALAMAAAAWAQAAALQPPEDDEGLAIGVGVTASLVSGVPKRGPHRAFIAVQSLGGTSVGHVEFEKGRRSRVEEDALVADAALAAVVAFLSADPTQRPPGLGQGDTFTAKAAAFPTPVTGLLDGTLDSVLWLPSAGSGDDGLWPTADDIRPGLPESGEDDALRVRIGPRWGGVLSGSFNPRHAGHVRLREAAAAHLGQPVGWELPVANAEKPPLDAVSLRRRLAAFDADPAPVLLTRAATFAQKAGLLPGVVFVVGYDTAVRVLEGRFYGSAAARDAALDDLAAHGCRFLVAARLEGGTLKTAADLDAGRFAALFEPLPVEAFREDISSTELRAASPPGSGIRGQGSG